ncbi:hypothetical protein [Kitasatospora aureofaciens]|uniref:hypothetical protein n=1 Tax=Kitasatospora aureofaciens TaxID=1894 RepID=UPI0037CA11CA
MFCFQYDQPHRSTATHGNPRRSASALRILPLRTAGIADAGRQRCCRRATKSRASDEPDDDAAAFVPYTVITTLTNADFDPSRLGALIREPATVRDRFRELFERAALEALAPRRPERDARLAWQGRTSSAPLAVHSPQEPNSGRPNRQALRDPSDLAHLAEEPVSRGPSSPKSK